MALWSIYSCFMGIILYVAVQVGYENGAKILGVATIPLMVYPRLMVALLSCCFLRRKTVSSSDQNGESESDGSSTTSGYKISVCKDLLPCCFPQPDSEETTDVVYITQHTDNGQPEEEQPSELQVIKIATSILIINESLLVA